MKTLFASLLIALVAVSQAAAQTPDLDVSTPAVTVIKNSLAQRFTKLKPHFDTGVIGLTHDGLVAIRDLTLVAAGERLAVENYVAEENKDRAVLYREIARANGRADWETDLKLTFGQRWISRAYLGWYYRDSTGKWQKKG
jgi:uncharacterized protein YdbL (DUF1318 family)